MYEVGDKVIYQGADKNAYKKVGVLKSIEEKDGKPQLTVEFEGGETFTAPVDDWSKEFTNAATNAKFKVGDKVKVVGKGLASKGWVGKVAKVRSGGWPYVVKFDGREDGEYAEEEIAIANSCSCTSTNSIVRNALGFEPQITDAQWTEAYKWFEANGYKVHASDEGGFTFKKPIMGKQFYNEKDGWNLYKKLSRNAATNAKLEVGDKVRVWQAPIRGQYGKVVRVGLMEYDVEVDGKVYPKIDYRRIVKAANSCVSTNSVVCNAVAANRRVACNADIYSLVKQEFKAQYPYKDFGIDMRLEPDGKFKIWEVGSAHGPNDSSGVDWKRIAAKVKSAMGSQISSIKVTPYDNGVEGVMAKNSVARNAGGAYDFAAQAGKRFKDAYEALSGCAYYLDRLSTLGAPDDVRGNDAKIASWAKDKQKKVRSIMAELDQGKL